jgi:hypothetical protein
MKLVIIADCRKARIVPSLEYKTLLRGKSGQPQFDERQRQ